MMTSGPKQPTRRDTARAGRYGVRVFVDFWNYTLSMREVDPAFRTDWSKLGPALSRATATVEKRSPTCGADMRGTEEKGVDVRMATDMISLAWSHNYDVAVLVSSDRDFIPVAEFLGDRGLKVIHGAIPPKGAHLSTACWGSIDLRRLRERFRRA